jgi:hypothetical protein
MSWASIVKNTSSSSSSSSSAGAPNSIKPVPSAPIPIPAAPAASSAHLKCNNPVDYDWLKTSWKIDNDAYDRGQRELEVEIQKGSRPDNIRLRRPGAATSLPMTFVTSEDYYTWICSEKGQNRVYSDELFAERMREWRTKMNWHLPPHKKSVTDQERRQGFYTATVRDSVSDELISVVKYVTPYSSIRDVENEELVEMMWCLVYSRADELVACKTVAEFTDLFNRTAHLSFPSWKIFNRKSLMPKTLLWILSQKANIFPGRSRPGTAVWECDPSTLSWQQVARAKSSSSYTKSMVFFNNISPFYKVGQPGGRPETGICVVEHMSRDGENAKIRWLLTAKQLREIERVKFSPDIDPFPSSYSGFSSDDEWLDWP